MTVAALSPARPRRWLLVLVCALLMTAAVVALGNLPWQRAVHLVRNANPWWLVVAIAMNGAILLLWAAEWRILLPDSGKASYGRMFEIVSITASILNTVPFFAGEASAVALLITRAELSAGAAASVLALDQLLVGVGKVVVIVCAAATAPMPSWLRVGVLSLTAGVVALAVALVSLAHRSAAEQRTPVTPRGRLGRARAFLIGLGTHLDALRSMRRVRRVVTLTLFKKAVELSAVLAVQMSFRGTASLGTGLLILAALSLVTIVPVTPANLGIYEASVFAIYRFVGASPDAALAMATVQHVCFLLPSILVGYITLSLRHLPLPTPRGR